MKKIHKITIIFKKIMSNTAKKIKVSIQDENTLILLEDASKGDLIDLKSIHETDIDKTSITKIVNSIKMEKFNEKVQEEVQKAVDNAKKDFNLELLQRENSVREAERKKLDEKEKEIAELKMKQNNAETEKKLAISEATKSVEQERNNLANELKNKEMEKELMEKSLKESYEEKLRNKEENFAKEIKSKEEMIEYYKDLKLKMSTKMLGETLEQHCETEFNKLRATAFQRAYFEKDNDARTGSKGDYIYRENDDNGNELISIMFEMKNEGDTTATKKKNEDFFKELDKDRNEKKM